MSVASSGSSDELQRLARHKRRSNEVGVALGPEMISFFKHAVEKRHTKLSKIAECWGVLVPETLVDHCSLESFSRGSLTVIVDSSSHLYELKQLLLAGLQQQLFLACKSTGLKKINLRPGRWYEGDNRHKLRF